MDSRIIRSVVRMPMGYPEGDPHQKPNAKGAVLTDPDELQKLGDAKKVNLQNLYDRGVIAGEGWKGVKVKK